MQGRKLFAILSLACVLLTLGITAQRSIAEPPADGAAGKPRPSNESLERWEWYLEIQPPEKAKTEDARYGDVLLPPSVFGRAREDLNDLRLRDARDREVPFALRIRRPVDIQQPLRTTEYDRSTPKPGESAQVKLDLGKDPPKHNAIDILTAGSNFRRRVLVEASDAGEEWSPLVEKADLLSFHVGQESVDVHRFRYDQSGRRRVRVSVSPDPGVEKDRPTIVSVTVVHSTQVPGLDVALPASLGYRQDARIDARVASAWSVRLPDPFVPCERLTVEILDEFIARSYRLELIRSDGTYEVLKSGAWERQAGSGKTQTIEFREVRASELRLIVFDDRNPPLNITRAEYSAPARQLIFEATSELAWPLRLYFGNPEAQAPNYDFAHSVPAATELTTVRAVIDSGPPQSNPDYHPLPRPWTERWPWLVYVVLGTSSAVLLIILGLLGREAIAQSDTV